MKKTKVTIKIITLLILIVIIGFVFSTNRKADLEKGAYLNGEKILTDDYIVRDGDSYFINYYLLEEYEIIDSFHDVDSNYIQIFSENEIYEVNYNIESNTYINKENNIYINYNYLKNKTDYNINIFGNGDFIYIDSYNNKILTTDKTKLKSENLITSGNIRKLDSGQELVLYKYINDWALVRTEEFLGYLKIKDIKSFNRTNSYKIKSISTKENIVVAWDLFNRKYDSIVNYVYYEDLDVIAPTWHNLDKEKVMTDWYLEEYYNYYKEKGVDFWGVFSNSFDRDLSSYFLRDRNRRKETVETIIEISRKYKYDGINLDFENLHYEDRDYLTAFIKELYIESLKHNLTFSVDITAVSESQNWSLIYDREQISKYSDYLALMAYDATTSPEQGVGPIASLQWVENAVVELKEITGRNNIILGVPFYTRLWEETETAEGILRDSTALRVESAQNFINKNEIYMTYDSESKQNYGEKKIDDTIYRIWMEDEISLGYRMDLVTQYDLKGIAIWALDYSTDELWQKIYEKTRINH